MPAKKKLREVWRLLVNPTLVEVNAALDQAAARVNAGYRTRRVALAVDAQRWRRVANYGFAGGYRSDDQRQTTGILGYAWIPVRGARVVAVHALRTRCSVIYTGCNQVPPFTGFLYGNMYGVRPQAQAWVRWTYHQTAVRLIDAVSADEYSVDARLPSDLDDMVTRDALAAAFPLYRTTWRYDRQLVADLAAVCDIP